jgi:hypothetical protein
MIDPATIKAGLVHSGLTCCKITSTWLENMVVRMAGALPLACTKRKNSNWAKKMISPMAAVKYQPPSRVTANANNTAAKPLTQRAPMGAPRHVGWPNTSCPRLQQIDVQAESRRNPPSGVQDSRLRDGVLMRLLQWKRLLP